MSAPTVPVMDNCCTCENDLGYEEMQVKAQKAWPGYLPFAGYAGGSSSDSATAPVAPAPWPTGTGCMGTFGPWAAAHQVSDANAPTKYLKQTLVLSIPCLIIIDTENGSVGPNLSVTLVSEVDARDGALIYQEQTFNPSPVPDRYGPPYAGRKSATWRLNDNGSVTTTGTQPTTYLDPANLSYYQNPWPSNDNDIGYWTAWANDVTPTSCTGMLTDLYFLVLSPPYNWSYEQLAVTWTYTLSVPYTADAALNDAVSLLAWGDLTNRTSYPTGGSRIIAYERDALGSATPGIHLVSTYSMRFLLGAGEKEFESGIASAQMSYVLNGADPVAVYKDVQLPMAESAAASPNTGHGPVAGPAHMWVKTFGADDAMLIDPSLLGADWGVLYLGDVPGAHVATDTTPAATDTRPL